MLNMGWMLTLVLMSSSPGSPDPAHQWLKKEHPKIAARLKSPDYPHFSALFGAWRELVLLHRHQNKGRLHLWLQQVAKLSLRSTRHLRRYPGALPYFLLAPRQTARILRMHGPIGLGALSFISLRCGGSSLKYIMQPLIHHPRRSKTLLRLLGVEGILLLYRWGWLFSKFNARGDQALRLALFIRRNQEWMVKLPRQSLTRFMRWLWLDQRLFSMALRRPGVAQYLYQSSTRRLRAAALRKAGPELLDVVHLLHAKAKLHISVLQSALHHGQAALYFFLRFQRQGDHRFWKIMERYGSRIIPQLWTKLQIDKLLKKCQSKKSQISWFKCKILYGMEGSDPINDKINQIYQGRIHSKVTIMGIDTKKLPKGEIIKVMVLLASGKTLSHEEKFWFAFDLVMTIAELGLTFSSGGSGVGGAKAAMASLRKIVTAIAKEGIKRGVRTATKQLAIEQLKVQLIRIVRKRSRSLFRKRRAETFMSKVQRKLIQEGSRACSTLKMDWKPRILCKSIVRFSVKNMTHRLPEKIALTQINKSIKAQNQAQKKKQARRHQRQLRALSRRTLLEHDALFIYKASSQLVLPFATFDALAESAFPTSDLLPKIRLALPQTRYYELPLTSYPKRLVFALQVPEQQFLTRVTKERAWTQLSVLSLLRMEELIDSWKKDVKCSEGRRVPTPRHLKGKRNSTKK